MMNKACLIIASLFCAILLACTEPVVVEKPIVQCWDGSTTESIEQCPPLPQIREEPKIEAQLKDVGDFKVVYASSTKYNDLQRALQEQKYFDPGIDILNEQLILPSDVSVVLLECGEANAQYDPDSYQIKMCYELIEQIVSLFSNYNESEEELDVWTSHALAFIFYHEVGHALTHLLNLPVTGKGEDSVDQLATLVLTEIGEVGEDAALNAAVFFLELSEQTNIEDLAFWDEHSLDEQRFYNIACWVYGKNPERHNYLIEKELLPEERAERCVAEYQQLSNSWNTLLIPYFKEQVDS